MLRKKDISTLPTSENISWLLSSEELTGILHVRGHELRKARNLPKGLQMARPLTRVLGISFPSASTHQQNPDAS